MTTTTMTGLLALQESSRKPETGVLYEGSGKIRELFSLTPTFGDREIELLGPYATSRISARDFVFGFLIPDLGTIRNMMTAYFKRLLERNGIKTDFVRAGRGIDDYLPMSCKNNIDLRKNFSVVRRGVVIPYEIIFRFNLLGSMWVEYLYQCELAEKRDRIYKHVHVWGHKLPRHLVEGSALVPAVFTPTTKAKVGHDVPVTAADVELQYPGIEAAGRRVAEFLHDHMQDETAIRLLDLKIEMMQDKDGSFVLCDEFSPDSARFCRAEEYRNLTLGKKVEFLDKEWFRKNYADVAEDGIIKMLDPTYDHDMALVKTWEAPPEVIAEVQRRYRETFWLATGYRLEECLKDVFAVS